MRYYVESVGDMELEQWTCNIINVGTIFPSP